MKHYDIKIPEERAKEWLSLLIPVFDLEYHLLSEAIDYGQGAIYTKLDINELEEKMKQAKDLISPFRELLESFSYRLGEAERQYKSIIDITKNKR